MFILANALHIPLSDGSVQCVVTSPPYWGLRDYGLEPTIWGGDTACEHVWGEERSAVKRQEQRDHNGRNFGDTRGTEPSRVGIAMSVSQGAYCQLCGAWHGCLGLEPTPELYVEHIVAVFREVRRVLRDDGTIWLDLGDSYASSAFSARPGGRGAGITGDKAHTDIPRPPVPAGLKPKDLCGIPWRVAFALQADGWYLRSDIIWAKPNPMPESVTDRPTKAHEYVFLLTKSERYYWDQEAVKEPVAQSTIGRSPVSFGGAKGRAYTPEKNDPNYRNGSEQWGRTFDYKQSCANGRNIRTVWIIATQPFKGAHFAPMPPALVEPCIKAGTSERGACPHCGTPWARVVEKGLTAHDGDTESAYSEGTTANRLARLRQAARERGAEYVNDARTVGWRSTCDCPEHEPVACVVLDPFCGSGTVGLVAAKFGRSFVGLDLQPKYLPLARARSDGVPMALAGV